MNGPITRTRPGVLMTMLLVVAMSAPLFACPICFQLEQGPVADGMRAAVFVLIGVTLVVLAGFIRFAIRVARRGEAIARTEPQP